MELKNWLNESIEKYKGRSNVIPINNELLGFCNGDYPTAALLTQLLYWKDKTRIKGGWIAKSAKNWHEELHLSQNQISRIAKQLVKLKLIETKLKKFNGSPITHYRLKETELKKVFLQYLETGISILKKAVNPIEGKHEMDFEENSKSILRKVVNPIKGKHEIDFAESSKSITDTTTDIKTDIKTEKKTDRIFFPSEIIDFNDFENSEITSDVVPKEKSCGKKEKVMVRLPFESEGFEQVWNGWKSYLLEKFNREYSEFEEQAALMSLQNYDEEFAKELITKAISSGWKSFHYANTSNEFQKHLINKNKNYEQSSRTFRTNEFRNAINERGDELWGDFDE
jgi:hypothetical protein